MYGFAYVWLWAFTLPCSYPKIEFFQSNQMRNVMVDILFIFAKENPEVSYQQVGLLLQPGWLGVNHQYLTVEASTVCAVVVVLCDMGACRAVGRCRYGNLALNGNDDDDDYNSNDNN